MSRAASGILRVSGEVRVNTLGTIDFGTIASPIPAGVKAELQCLGGGGYGLTCNDNSESYFVGTPTRTRRTKLIVAVVPGNTSIRVQDATGWVAGDYVTLSASGNNFNGPFLGVVVSTTFNAPGDWTVSFGAVTIPNNYAINKPVGNLANNVGVYGVLASSPYTMDLGVGNVTQAGIRNAYFLNNGTVRANTRVVRSAYFGTGGYPGGNQFVVENRVLDSTVWSENRDLTMSGRGAGGGMFFNCQVGTFRVVGAVFDIGIFAYGGFVFQNSSSGFYIEDFMVNYGALNTGQGGWAGVTFKNGSFGATFIFNQAYFPSATLFEDVDFGYAANNFVIQSAGSGLTFRRCSFGLPYSEDPARGFMEVSGGGIRWLPNYTPTTSGQSTLIDCIFESAMSDAAVDAWYGVGGGGGLAGCPSPDSKVVISNKNGDPSKQTIYTNGGVFRNDTSVYRSAPYSLRYSPNSRNAPSSLTFNIIAPNNAQVPVSGFVRRDATYRSAGGTVVATLSGPGITTVSYTSSGAADVWEQFAFNVIQSTGAPAVLTLTLTFTGTAGNAYADDIVAPSSQAVSTGEFTYWASGQPIQTILANFAPAADVWSIPIANLTTPSSVGEALANVEDGNNIQEALRLLLAVALGDVSGGPGAPVFKSLDGTKDRVVGTATPNGDRTRTSIDPS
jgi:hypothetical protein